MGLERVGDIMRDGCERGYGVAAFNCFNFESIRYAIDTAEEEQMPVIIMLYPGMRSHIALSTFSAITRDLAAKARVPVGLHLDHCDNYELLLESIHAGFPSVIIDASKFDYDTNVRMTQEVVRAAHAMDCEVEAELGHVGSAATVEDYLDKSKYTDPEQAARFVEETGVDYLAVAIGNAHGKYVVEPQIDVERVCRLRELLSIPMVMHGGSGIPDEQLAPCVRQGVSKYNFGTNYQLAFYDATREVLPKETRFPGGLWIQREIAPAVKDFIRGRIQALNPDNKKIF